MPAQQKLLAAARAQRRAVAAPRSHVATHRQQTLSFANNLQSGRTAAVRSESEAYLSMPHKCDACAMGFKRLQALRSHDNSSAHRHELRLAAKGAAPMPQASSSGAASSPAALQISATPAPRSADRTARAPPRAMDAGSTSVEPGAPPDAVTTASTPVPFATGGKSCGSCFGFLRGDARGSRRLRHRIRTASGESRRGARAPLSNSCALLAAEAEARCAPAIDAARGSSACKSVLLSCICECQLLIAETRCSPVLRAAFVS